MKGEKMPSVFAVCDIETEYAIRFMEFLNRKNLPFEVQMKYIDDYHDVFRVFLGEGLNKYHT